MPPTEVQWLPALVVLGGGLVLGAFLVFWVRRRGGPAIDTAAPALPLELRDLDGRIAVLLRQLRELDDMASKRTPEQLARERYALELEAAHALQEREAQAPSPQQQPQPSAAATGAPAGGGALRGFLWGVGSSAAVALLLYLAWQASDRRPEGGSVTGSLPARAPSAAPAPEPASDEQTLELRAVLERNPGDDATRLDLARHLLMQRDLMGVWNETQKVLEHKPGDPRALSYQALVRMAMGQGELAISMLQQAIAAEPDLLEARQNLAFVYASLGRTQESEAAIAEVERRSPEDAVRLRQALSQLAAARVEAPAASGEDPHRGVAPPAVAATNPETAPSAGQAAPAAADGRIGGVFGWIEADAAVAARIRPGTAVFLTVREAGVAQGPPTAVKRMVSGSFPLQFEIGSEDSMIGQPLPDKMRIDVRADSDGDPMTRPDSDPAGHADGVELGRTGVRITLK